MKVFIDTSAFCALVNARDKDHSLSKKIMKMLIRRDAELFTSNFILDETYTLLKVRADTKRAIEFMDKIEKKDTKVFHVSEEIEKKAKSIFKKYADKEFSFTDCTSFVLIEDKGLNGAFAFDDHFKEYGFKRHIELFDLQITSIS